MLAIKNQVEDNLHYGIHHYLTKSVDLFLIFNIHYLTVQKNSLSYHHYLYHDIIHIHVYRTSVKQTKSLITG